MPILSTNSKTGVSLNFPVSNCTPTKVCEATCYARRHYLIGPTCTAKWNRNSEYLSNTKDCRELIAEARMYTSIRLCGTGDLIQAHVPGLLKLAKGSPQTMIWGMTRKIKVATAVNGRLPNLKLMVSVDASSPKNVWDYDGVLCYGPRRAEDRIPEDDRIITVFPYHSSGKVVGQVPDDPRDCPAVRHKVSGCSECGRCFTW